MDRHTFRQLASLRLREAKTLLRNGHYEGAYYLCGYSVECALKACLARQTKRYAFPPKVEDVREYYYTHKLPKLLDRVGGPLATEMTGDKNWAVVRGWSEETRYSVGTPKELAQQLYSAVADKKSGVLKCIKKYW